MIWFSATGKRLEPCSDESFFYNMQGWIGLYKGRTFCLFGKGFNWAPIGRRKGRLWRDMAQQCVLLSAIIPLGLHRYLKQWWSLYRYYLARFSANLTRALFASLLEYCRVLPSSP